MMTTSQTKHTTTKTTTYLVKKSGYTHQERYGYPNSHEFPATWIF